MQLVFILDSMLLTHQCYYWLLASVCSGLLAAYAFKIHSIEETVAQRVTKSHSDSVEIETHVSIKKPIGYRDVEWPIKIHQFLLNFLGSMVGWVTLYFLIKNYFNTFDGWEKLILSAVSFLGITGYLPYILLQKGFPWSK